MQFIRRAKQPELPVILLEDFAALIGLVFALLGVGLSLLTGSLYWDVAGTALIGLLLVAVAIVLGIETKSLLLGEAAARRGAAPDPRGARAGRRHRGRHPHADDAPRPRGAAGGREGAGARRGDRCRGRDAIDRAEAAVREAEPIARVIYVEPRQSPAGGVRRALIGAVSAAPLNRRVRLAHEIVARRSHTAGDRPARCALPDTTSHSQGHF